MDNEAPPMNKSNVIAGVICLAFGAFAYWLSGGVSASTMVDPLGGRFFPRMIAILFMLASIALIVTGLLNIEIAGGTAPKKSTSAPDEQMEGPPAASLGNPNKKFGIGEARLIGFLVVMILYSLAIPLFGYILSSLLVFAAFVWIAGEHRMMRVVLTSVVLTTVLYVLFAVVLRMNVPQASLF
jgi:hypothetical protein